MLLESFHAILQSREANTGIECSGEIKLLVVRTLPINCINAIKIRMIGEKEKKRPKGN